MRSFDCSSNLSGVAIFVYDPIGRLQTRLSNKFDPVAFGVMYIERFLTISTLNRAFYDLVTSRFYCRKLKLDSPPLECWCLSSAKFAL